VAKSAVAVEHGALKNDRSAASDGAAREPERNPMKSFKRFAVAALAVLTLAAGPTVSVRGEPMPTLIEFDRGTYDDSASSRIVVRIRRVDQEPSSGANEQVSVDCTIDGGTAVRGVDYRLDFDGGVQGLGTITFPPGVFERRFTITALNVAGTEKTLVIGLTNPTGPALVATGNNSVAKITINAPALKAAPSKQTPDRKLKTSAAEE